MQSKQRMQTRTSGTMGVICLDSKDPIALRRGSDAAECPLRSEFRRTIMAARVQAAGIESVARGPPRGSGESGLLETDCASATPSSAVGRIPAC